MRQSIGAFHLANDGGFVCAGKCQFIDNDGGTGVSDRWSMIPLGQSETMNPADRDMQDGYMLQMYVDIEAGNDRTGGAYFLFDPTSKLTAKYRITGTTLNSTMHFDGVS